ncbi:LemA protein [Parelusimicrobium proximum]|uniref:LemA family protein n=1 Tax=Parelusimicrobium proximum TaxID=3228953 RepID=UPI003D174DA5
MTLIGLIFLVIVILICVVYPIAIYNSFITLKTRVAEAWSDIEVQMKRRYDLIPNLVETVKGYASHERETLEKVIQARNMAMNNPHSVEGVAQSDNMISGALKSLFALSEKYPDLKANQNFLEMQRDLRDTEDKLQAARRFYNGNVMQLNAKVDYFPSNIIAKLFGFEKSKFFELSESDAAAKDAVKVKF